MLISHLYTERLFEPFTVAQWKLNMAAVSSQHALLFIAKTRRVLVYHINHYARVPVFVTRLDYPWPPSPTDEINAISLGGLSSEEVLVAVYDNGGACAWKLSDSFDILWKRSTGVSTWGCALHDSCGIVATSANSHNIDVLYPSDVSSSTGSANGQETTPNEENAHVFQGEVEVIEGHTDNIPSVVFSAAGKYIASASIDLTVRVWSLESKAPVFTFEYAQECWSALFVYPFFFMPSSMDCKPQHGADRIQFDEREEENVGAAHLYDIMSSEESSSDFAELDTRSYVYDELTPVVDHTTDLQNGHVSASNASNRSTASSESNKDEQEELSNQEACSVVAGTAAVSRFQEESTDPRYSKTLLLCGTRSDLLLLDPTKPLDPAVDIIRHVVSRTPMPTLIEMLTFDRISFLAWIPELAVAIAGSLTGTIAIIRLECSYTTTAANPRYKMRVVAHLPEPTRSCPLYGVSIYRHPIDTSQFRAVTLYLAYLNGDISAYEMRLVQEQYLDLHHF
ncbi:hypothetical protein GGI26_002137 [Coemansia sp. RSA 1358]|nr:hypothetical protein GGI26_002137 [Coemansia sp. RSA 1358]